jgi:hypothetical protein
MRYQSVWCLSAAGRAPGSRSWLMVTLASGGGSGRLRMMIGAWAVATSVAGCATTWVRPGGESSDLGHDNELGRDDVECQFEASKLTSSAGMEGAAAEQKRAELEALCMQARGWSRQ